MLYYKKEVRELKNLLCPNDLIDSSKKHSILELKIFYTMIYKAKMESKAMQIEVDDEIDLYIGDLMKDINTKHLSKVDMANIIVDIPKGIYFDNLKGYVSAFETIHYDDLEQIITFQLCKSFAEYVEDITNKFTVLELVAFSKLRSSYSQRMFEFASKNKNLPAYKMPINDFKKYFKVPVNYNMCNIDQRILNQASEELEKSTSLRVKHKKIKVANRVTHILFEISEV